MKLDRMQALGIFLAIALVVAAAISYNFLFSDKPVTKYTFQGVELSFRDDLRLAKNITLAPSEEAILYTIWNPDVQSISIVYMNTTDNQFTAVNAFEVAFKLNVAYGQFSWFVNFTGKEVESFDNLNATDENLVIVMVPPSLALETSVELQRNIIYIKGKTPQEFDLATIKFIMAALNITV
jgi:hypothetical protein